MYYIRSLIYTFVYIQVVFSESLNDVESKNILARRNALNSTGDLNFKCERTLCVQKCCPLGQYVFRMACVNSKGLLNFSQVDVYDENKLKTEKSLTDTFGILPGAFNDEAFKDLILDINIFRKYRPYVDKDGALWLELPNAYQRWIKMNRTDYCVDYVLTKNNPNKPSISFFVILPDTNKQQDNDYLTYATLVSCVSMLLVLAVYAALPELRNLCGMILMAYVASLFWAFLLLAVIQFGGHVDLMCFYLSLFTYFFFLASFCWMNVMSYDIWWTFRGYAKDRRIHRRGERFKFLTYCLYAWGVPLLMTIGMGVANTIDLTHIPWFITPNIPRMGCFLEGGVKFLYLYVPMLIMIMLNWLFYMMTAYNVWRLGRGSAVLANSMARGTVSAHRTQRSRLMVYLKLSIVMGLNWLLEVVSFIWPDFNIWYISDAYNMLIGFAIFLIFVCKKKILRKLVNRYHVKKTQWNQSSKSYASSSSDSISNQETTTLQISPNPRGF